MFMSFFVVLCILMLLSMPTIHLPSIMALDTLNCLPEAIPTAVLMIRMTEFVFMKYDAGAFRRIFRAVKIPIMTGVPALNRHVPVIRHYDIEIPRIYLC